MRCLKNFVARWTTPEPGCMRKNCRCPSRRSSARLLMELAYCGAVQRAMTGLAPGFDLLRSSWPLLAASDEKVTTRLNVTAAWDGAQIAQVDVAGERHVQDALFAAFSMFRQKDRWLSYERRLELLGKIVSLLDENRECLALESARETGKPITDARREVQRAIDCAVTASARLQGDEDDDFPPETRHQAADSVWLHRTRRGGGGSTGSQPWSGTRGALSVCSRCRWVSDHNQTLCRCAAFVFAV